MSQNVAKLDDGTEAHLKTGGEQVTFTNKTVAGSIDPECAKVFQLLKIRRKHRFIVYKIDSATEAVVPETIGARASGLAEMLAALPDADSRYVIFDYEFTTYDGRPTNKLFFLSWFPNNSTPYAKMAYTQAKSKVREIFTGVFDIMARTTEEARCLIVGEQEEESDQESARRVRWTAVFEARHSVPRPTRRRTQVRRRRLLARARPPPAPTPKTGPSRARVVSAR